jgi:hypothetical protein
VRLNRAGRRLVRAFKRMDRVSMRLDRAGRRLGRAGRRLRRKWSILVADTGRDQSLQHNIKSAHTVRSFIEEGRV